MGMVGKNRGMSYTVADKLWEPDLQGKYASFVLLLNA